MARWSGVNEPDDPLRADDPLVGAQHEDVLLGSGTAVDDDEPAAEHADDGHEDAAESPVAAAVLDDRPTTKLPPVVAPASEPQGRWNGAAPWAVFAAVAVVVITATTTLASWLQGPTAERQSFTGLLQPPPTSAVAPAAPVAPAEPAPPPPAAEPEPQPEADPDPAPAARPTERPRPTRAQQPAAPPPAAAVNAPASRTPKPEGESPAKTSAPKGPSAADADTLEKDVEKEPADADKAKPADEEDSGSDE